MSVKQKKAPLPAFVRKIQATLTYWKTRTARLDSEAMAKLDSERENLFQAILFGQRLEAAWEDTAVIVWQIRYFVSQMGYWTDWMPIVEWVLETCHPSEQLTKFRLLIAYGEQLRNLGKLQEATRLHESALQIASQLDKPDLLIEASCVLGETFIYQRKFEQAQIHCADAMALLQQHNHDKAWQATALHLLGVIAFNNKEYERSKSQLRASSMLRRELAQPLPLARALSALGSTYRASQDFIQAYDCYEEGLQLLASTVYGRDQIMLGINLGVLYDSQGKHEEAFLVFQQAYDSILARPADITFRAILTNNLGYVSLSLNQLADAEFYLEQAITVKRQQAEHSASLAYSIGTLGKVFAAKGDQEEALKLLDESLAMLQLFEGDAWAKDLHADFQTVKETLA
ncbi:MAG: tetratricopeptide repeat protein [Chloroflexota bacterium]